MGQYYTSLRTAGTRYKPAPFPNDSGDGKYFTSLRYVAPINGILDAVLSLTEAGDSVSANILTGYALAGALAEAGDGVACTILTGYALAGALVEASDGIAGTILTGYTVAGALIEANDNVAVALALAGAISFALVEGNDSVAVAVLTGFTMALAIAEAGDSVSAHLHGDTDAPVIDSRYLIVAPHRIRTLTPS